MRTTKLGRTVTKYIFLDREENMKTTVAVLFAAFQTAPTPRHAAVQLNFFEKLLKELDNFADDAMGRRLGQGAKFYGKRKSNFYGEDDPLRKIDAGSFNSEEDYSGPAGGSFFVLSKERDEEGRPMGFLTRKEARAQKEADEAARWELARREEEEQKTVLDEFKVSKFKAGLQGMELDESGEQ